MKFSKHIYSAIFFIALLLIFFLSKYQYLGLPYFWDEAWVYGNAVGYFLENGIRFFPSEESLDLTRGHPMLFQFLFSCWGSIFGGGYFSLHLFSCLIAAILLIVVYRIGIEYMHPAAALIAPSFLIGHEIFFVQSTLVLPEVLLSLFLLLSIYYFLKGNVFLFIASFTAALYTKESAVVLIPLFIIISIYCKLSKQDLQSKLVKVYYLLFPLSLASLHYIYQKISFGWYFYPHHIDLIKFDFDTIMNNLNGFVGSLFIEDYKWLILVLFIGLLGIRVHTRLNTALRYSNLIILGITFATLIYYLMTGKQLLLLSMIFLYSGLAAYFSFNLKFSKQSLFEFTCWIFIIGYIGFCTLNFYTIRYAVPILVVFSLLVGSLFHSLFGKRKPYYYVLSVVLLVAMTLSSNHKHHLLDIDKGYKYAIRAHQELAKYLLENYPKEFPIIADFLERINLTNHRVGYLGKDEEYNQVFGYDISSADLKIISNVAGSIESKRDALDPNIWTLEKQIKNKRCVVELYSKMKSKQ